MTELQVSFSSICFEWTESIFEKLVLACAVVIKLLYDSLQMDYMLMPAAVTCGCSHLP